MGWDLEVSTGKCEGGDLQIRNIGDLCLTCRTLEAVVVSQRVQGLGAREDPATSLSPELWRAPIWGHEARSEAAKMQNEEENPGSVVLNLGWGQC